MIQILLVDDHAVVRAGYRRLLESMPDIVVDGEAENCEQVCCAIAEKSFDVIILDISLPGVSGLETMRRILAHDPEARVLMFSMHEDIVFSTRALQAGARGYITKSSSPEVMVEAVRTIARGQHYVGRDVAQAMVMHHLMSKEDSLSALTEREFEIFGMLVEGKSLPQISASLALNYKTIANHQSSIRHKLGVENRLQMIHLAIAHGLLTPESVLKDANPA